MTDLVKKVRQTGVPVIYFGTDSATLLTSMKRTGADVIGLDWRIPLDEGWRALKHDVAVQGNLDPVALFAPLPDAQCAMDPLTRAAFETLDAATKAALDPVLLEHRDLMYERHLALPLSL